MTSNEKLFKTDAFNALKQIHLETALLQAGVEAYQTDYPGESVEVMQELDRYIQIIKSTNLKLEQMIEKNPLNFILMTEVTFDSLTTCGTVLMKKVKAKGIHHISWGYRSWPRVNELLKDRYPEDAAKYPEELARMKDLHEQILAGTYQDPQDLLNKQLQEARAELDKLNDPNQPADGKKFLQKLGIA